MSIYFVISGTWPNNTCFNSSQNRRNMYWLNSIRLWKCFIICRFPGMFLKWSVKMFPSKFPRKRLVFFNFFKFRMFVQQPFETSKPFADSRFSFHYRSSLRLSSQINRLREVTRQMMVYLSPSSLSKITYFVHRACMLCLHSWHEENVICNVCVLMTVI